jgi:hypothetical protein
MHSVSTSVVITVIALDAKCWLAPYTFATDLDTKINIVSPKFSIGGAFYIKSAAFIAVFNSKIYNCYLCD